MVWAKGGRSTGWWERSVGVDGNQLGWESGFELLASHFYFASAAMRGFVGDGGWWASSGTGREREKEGNGKWPEKFGRLAVQPWGMGMG